MSLVLVKIEGQPWMLVLSFHFKMGFSLGTEEMMS